MLIAILLNHSPLKAMEKETLMSLGTRAARKSGKTTKKVLTRATTSTNAVTQYVSVADVIAWVIYPISATRLNIR